MADDEPQGVERVAELLGVSRQLVARLEEKALAKVRRRAPALAAFLEGGGSRS